MQPILIYNFWKCSILCLSFPTIREEHSLSLFTAWIIALRLRYNMLQYDFLKCTDQPLK